MAEQCAVLTWNVRGLGTAVKLTQVFDVIHKTQAIKICLQETHMIKEHSHQLKKHGFGG